MGSTTIPSSRQRWSYWIKTPIPWDALAGLAGTVGTAIAGSRSAHAGETVYAWGYFVAAGVVLVVTFVKVITAVEDHRKRTSLHELAGCVHTLVAILLALEKAAVSGLRATILIPAQRKGFLEQAVEYVGDNRRGKSAGREFPVSCGISGWVFRNRMPRLAYLEDGASYDDFVREMMETWAFEEHHARALDPSARAWGAWPIEDSDSKVAGVLYLDAKQHDFFTPYRQNAISSSVTGIAFYIGLRYARP